MFAQQEQLVYGIAHRLAQDKGLDLVEVKISRHQRDVLIQILADRPQGGISLAECVLLNRAIVEAIDKEGIFSEDGHSLEVSSPGLDRPLITYKDFFRNLNREMHLWLKQEVESKKEYRGILVAATEMSLTLLTEKGQQEISMPLNQVSKGLLVI